MKRVIKSGYDIIDKGTTRGTSYRVKGEKRRLRDIVDKIYDEVELQGVSDYFANIKSAGKKYYIEYFRQRDGWMLEDAASELKSKIWKIVQELGYEDEVDIQLVPEDLSWITEQYGGTCYIVKVIVGK